MKIENSVIRQIEESKYLATENTWRYRVIIRLIFKKYEQMKYSLYKEEIYEGLKAYENFEEYSMENLKSDLDQLVNWKNLGATADTAKVKSVEEFKNREFRYSISPVTVEFERMLINIEHMNIENSSSLESSLVERFRDLVEKFTIMQNETDKVVYDWFKELNQSFLQLNRNYQDYISKFYSSKNEEIMRTTEFLIYKEGFIKYLREFIKSLQINSSVIKQVFTNLSEESISIIVNKVLAYERQIKTLDLELVDADYLELNKGRVESMMEWFLTFKGREPLIEQLINNTNEIIRKITRFAASIAEKKSNNGNRKEEYKQIAKRFMEAAKIEEAHLISGDIFGAFNLMKIICNENRETESLNSSIYEEVPRAFLIKPKVRTYREKTIKNPIKNREKEKQEKLEKVMEKRDGEQKIIFNYIKDSSIDFGELPVLPSSHRTLLLRLITKGMSKKRQWHRADMGLDYKVTLESQDNIILRCEDGNLSMPPYKIVFKED